MCRALILTCLLLSACAQHPASVGVATMGADRVITLTLRAEGPDGAIGDGRLTYRPGDRDYESVKRRLGGIRPGEVKPVPPWPEHP